MAQAIRNREAARTRFDQAQASVHTAQDELDAARRLALAARQMREEGAKACASAVRDASHAGIRNRPWWSWEKLRQTAGTVWHVAVEVAKIAVAVLGVVALVIGGPIAWAVFAAALVLLADALVRYGNGRASLWDVGFALLGCIPGTRGLTTLGGLAEGVRGAGQALREGRALTGARAYTTTLVRSLLPHGHTITPDGQLLMTGGDSLRDAHQAAKAASGSMYGTEHQLRSGLSLGFADQDEFSRFSDLLHEGLKEAGYPNAQGIMQGSSVTGISFKERIPFDSGRRSDFDVAIADNILFNKAREVGVLLRRGGTRTAPLRNRDLKALNLLELRNKLIEIAGRKVAFMPYRDFDAAVKRSPSIIIPKQ
ncbi:hypothetical protein [Frankia sp. Cppng1_Ct_nod]|uniref:hypothetical protein n=1 Tax=Frankia sp. Cppng1_Ct_nod TaxID=2897162 RepID=UPI0010410AAD|nr:hypothetical protein [Frankia sp. Cppng1_Ct_nod]